MKRLFNQMTKKQRHQFFGSLFAIIITGLLLIQSISHFSLGWFSLGNQVSANGSSVSVATKNFELRVSEGNIGYENLYTFIDLPITDSSATMTSLAEGTDSIIWRIAGESDVLSPGSQGTLEFDIVLLTANIEDIKFKLDFRCFTASIEEINDVEVVTGLSEITPTSSHSDEEKNGAILLSHHLMFFRNRTGNDESDYQYDGFIEDLSSFTLSPVQDALEENVYHATIYWIWPNTVGQILLDSSNATDQGYLGEDVVSLLNSSGETNDRSHVKNYLKNNMLFYSSSSDLSYFGDLVDDLYTKRGLSETFQSEYDTLSAGYNTADLMIGMNVNYVCAMLNADINE